MKPIAYLIVATICISALMSAGPTLVTLAHAAVPLVVAVGAVVALLRLVWYFTNRW